MQLQLHGGYGTDGRLGHDVVTRLQNIQILGKTAETPKLTSNHIAYLSSESPLGGNSHCFV